MAASRLKHEELRIEVRGPERASSAFICKVIADAFREVGITHLDVINQFGDDIDHTGTQDALRLARERNPLLDLAGIAICPEGPVVEEIVVHNDPDRMEDDDGETIAELEFEFDSDYD